MHTGGHGCDKCSCQARGSRLRRSKCRPCLLAGQLVLRPGTSLRNSTSAFAEQMGQHKKELVTHSATSPDFAGTPERWESALQWVVACRKTSQRLPFFVSRCDRFFALWPIQRKNRKAIVSKIAGPTIPNQNSGFVNQSSELGRLAAAKFAPILRTTGPPPPVLYNSTLPPSGPQVISSASPETLAA